MSMSLRVADAPVARASDPITSVLAGENPAAREASEIDVLRILRRAAKPLADAQIEHALDGFYTPQRVRTARAQLVRKGLVEPAGIRPGASPTERAAMTWKLAQR